MTNRDQFDKEHGLGIYKKHKVVDFYTNQEIPEIYIGDPQFLAAIDLTDSIIINSTEDYVFFFKHGKNQLLIEGFQEITERDLIRVDFINKTFYIEKNFFRAV